MTTLNEIEARRRRAAPVQKELFLFLAARLRAASTPLPAPREFTRAQIDAWIADDEEGMRQLKTPAE